MRDINANGDLNFTRECNIIILLSETISLTSISRLE